MGLVGLVGLDEGKYVATLEETVLLARAEYHPTLRWPRTRAPWYHAQPIYKLDIISSNGVHGDGEGFIEAMPNITLQLG